MRFVADLHIHSRYSRATSPDMNIPTLARWAKLKGIGLMGTGDFTHPLWMQELKRYLEICKGSGLFTHDGMYFMLTAEISSIYSQNGKCYRVHNLVMAPSFDIALEINKMLASHGNIASDGRPILGLSCLRLAEELFKISNDIMLVPAHIWTPWFSLFGSNSGFNRIEEAFGKYSEKITALETGLSSDPAMNWRLSQLDRYSLISNSDSHSPSRIGREANVFDCGLNYWEIKDTLEKKDKKRFLYTVEFYPEEGKYHYDGHRLCNIRFSPEETHQHKGICPKCKKALTRGVSYRVAELADRPIGFIPDNAIPFKSLVPFDEIVAEVKGTARNSKGVMQDYLDYVQKMGSEFYIMVQASSDELFKKLPEPIAMGVVKVREGSIKVIPGYDGEYGIIKIFGSEAEKKKKEKRDEQLTLFN